MRKTIILPVLFLIMIPRYSLPASAMDYPGTTFVDLSSILNQSLEDDGMPDNGQGGWTDEGINDMYIWPTFPTGLNKYSGFPFQVTSSTQNGHKNTVLMLRGKKKATTMPEEAEVKIPNAKGKYIFIMDQSAANVDGNNYPVVTYELKYSDGTTSKVTLNDEQGIRQWWNGKTAATSAPEFGRYTVFFGENLTTKQYKLCINVYAFKWQNPFPDKAIMSMKFISHVNSVPIIYAVTISDKDFSKSHAAFPMWSEPPAGYFDSREDLRKTVTADALKKNKMLCGIRSVEVIRDDILEVTVDEAITGGNTGHAAAARYQDPKYFKITSASDPEFKDGVAPMKVGRYSYEKWNGTAGAFTGILYWHSFYLELPKKIKSGNSYTVEIVKAIPAGFTSSTQINYDQTKTITKAIKINQGGYSSLSKKRFAYLGWWAGDRGAVKYDLLKDFKVIDESDGSSVVDGKIKGRMMGDVTSGENVYDMDIAKLGPGTYHLEIPGLGRSDTFKIGLDAVKEMYYHTARAFFHQRCGQELREPWTWAVKPACHTECWESGYIAGTNKDLNGGGRSGYVPFAGETKKYFVGGYHDAADYDVFADHLVSTAQLITAFECFPGVFKDNELNIPESGNGLPDILDEAEWGLSFFQLNQQPDGAVPAGRGNDSDSFDQLGYGKKRPPFGVLPPTMLSCMEYAAVAAQFARVLKGVDDARSQKYLKSAVAAYQAGERLEDEQSDDRKKDAMTAKAWAAGELFSTTGIQRYSDEFVKEYDSDYLRYPDPVISQYTAIYTWAYITTKQEGVDKRVRADCESDLMEKADGLVVRCEKTTGYRMSHGGDAYFQWGQGGNGGGFFSDSLLRAYMLSKDRKYLDAASMNMDFQLGCNPLSKTFITGIGPRCPVRPEISKVLYRNPSGEGETVKGITIYGLADVKFDWYPQTPKFRTWRDLWGWGSEVCSEFTICQTIGPSAIQYGIFYGLEAEAGKK